METKEERLEAMTKLVKLGDTVDTSVTELKTKLNDMNEEMRNLVKSLDILLDEITDMRDSIQE